MSLLHHPEVSSWLREHLLCRVEGVAGLFAITFDDGPDPRFTPRILDVLARHGAHGTFFMLRGALRRQASLVRELRAAGHEPAAHGAWHLPPPLLPAGLLAYEMSAAADALEHVTGERPRHWRPPFGMMGPVHARIAHRENLVPVLGDVYPDDAVNPGVARIVSRVQARLRAGSILILHDGSAWVGRDRSQTIEAVDTLLAWAAARGLRAVSVRELLSASGARASNEAPFYTWAPRGAESRPGAPVTP